jgi:SWI/SNF-related matrix-associated actin-dependent regulator of chromatin subfamily A-like protein 1
MKSRRILLLSGTPILARPNELYNLLRILRPDIFYSFKEFGLRYCNPRESYFGIDWTGSANMRELHLMLEKSVSYKLLVFKIIDDDPSP